MIVRQVDLKGVPPAPPEPDPVTPKPKLRSRRRRPVPPVLLDDIDRVDLAELRELYATTEEWGGAWDGGRDEDDDYA